jgi:hypothetical protein
MPSGATVPIMAETSSGIIEKTAGSSIDRAPAKHELEVGGLTPSPLIMKQNLAKPKNPFRLFQIRWKEPLGRPECPYLYRWTLLFLGFSIRVHHWIRSDDKRFFHDHACDFLSVVLRGKYTNVTSAGRAEVSAGQIWRSSAIGRHYLDIPPGGAWTLLFCGRPYHKWGFWTAAGQKMRPLRYFHKFGIPPCDCQ